MALFLSAALFSLLGLVKLYDFVIESEEGLLSTEGNSQESSISLGWERCRSWRAVATWVRSGLP